ncbi:glutamate racemase [Armatimonas sp.]|uniref:glutamate racemase n=1 Tax=Armatimonas sp. TaxID=1872638 RepID=UPI00286B4332|nr:glutamate racemase [Armatimonas sp.]
MLGVFDSGVGGLTVVREIQALLPSLSLSYIGDSVHAPYGSRSAEEIFRLSLAQSEFLLCEGCTALVIACNTATAAAASRLRAHFSPTPIIGMEPAVKPAAAATKSGVIGVCATVGTLQSARFAALLDRFAGDVTVLTRSCPGWVEAVEAGDFETPETLALLRHEIEPLLAAGADTLVLGCTHFPALRPQIQALVGPDITLIDTGAAVARRVAELVPETGDGVLSLATTGEVHAFSRAAQAILDLEQLPRVQRLHWKDGRLENA